MIIIKCGVLFWKTETAQVNFKTFIAPNCALSRSLSHALPMLPLLRSRIIVYAWVLVARHPTSYRMTAYLILIRKSTFDSSSSSSFRSTVDDDDLCFVNFSPHLIWHGTHSQQCKGWASERKSHKKINFMYRTPHRIFALHFRGFKLNLQLCDSFTCMSLIFHCCRCSAWCWTWVFSRDKSHLCRSRWPK